MREWVSFRKGMAGMAAVAREVLKEDAMSGAFFVFRNRGATCSASSSTRS